MKKNRKALLVYPKFPENSFWNFQDINKLFLLPSEFGEPKANMPPLGLLSIAPLLEKEYGRENITIVDLNNRLLDTSYIQEADDVYLSAMLTQRESFQEVATLAKQLGKTVIAGGPYVSEKMENVDHAFINEADLTLPIFLKDYFKGKAKKVYKSDRKPNVDEFLRPDYSYINVHNYTTMAVQFSRGCPHDCDFCDITQRFGRKMRTKNIDFVMEELNQLYDLGWRHQVMFIDDNFIGKPSEALELLKVLVDWQKEHGHPFEYFTQASVLLAEKSYEELLKLFAPANFSMVFLGIETPNEDSLRETNKAFNLKKGMTLVEKVRRIQEVGQIMILGGFIVGFDSDTDKIFEQQADFIKEIKLPVPMIGLLSPLPKTRLRDRLEKEKRLHDFGTEGDVAGSLAVTFKPSKMSEDELVQGYKDLLESVYMNMGEFYERCNDTIKYMARKKGKVPADKEGVLSVLKLFWVQGIKSSYRLKFWKYIIVNLIKYPVKLEYIFRLSAYGFHYNRLAKGLVSEEISGEFV